MPKVEMIATKGFKYLTRRLLPGDVFEAKNALEAKILTEVRKVAAVPLAKHSGAIATAMNVASQLTAKPRADDMKALRAAYRKKFGKGPGPSWDAATLREKIAG